MVEDEFDSVSWNAGN